MISNPADCKKIYGALQEISNSLTRIEAERALIKEIKSDLFDEYKEQLSRKDISHMAKVHHKQNFDQEVADREKFEILYEKIMLLKTGKPANAAE